MRCGDMAGSLGKTGLRTPPPASRLVAIALLLLWQAVGHVANGQEVHDIMIGSSLIDGYDMGVNSSGGRTDWLEEAGGYFKMDYPPGQTWGAVFVTVGPPQDPPRPSRDFSMFDTLSIEMKGDREGELVSVGIKTNVQPDNGRETKVRTTLGPEWRIYEYPLSSFRGTDPRILYVVAEFVFDGSIGRTVYFRNIRYLRR